MFPDFFSSPLIRDVCSADIPLSVPSDSAFVLGQEQDIKGGLFEKRQSFAGRIADFHLWNRPLSVNEIAELGTCGETRFAQFEVDFRYVYDSCHILLPSGDEFDWRIEGNGLDNFTAHWSYDAIQLSYMAGEDLCEDDFWLQNIYLTKPLYFLDAERTCTNLGGRLASIGTLQEYENVYGKLKRLVRREIDQIQGKCLFPKNEETIVRTNFTMHFASRFNPLIS